MWWMQQAEKARLDLLVNQVSLELALQKLASWMRQWGAVDKKFRTVLPVWGNGSDFDNVILGNAFKACRMDPPWAYRNNRCFRTLKELAKARGDVVKPVFQGTAHNALDDAIYQAQCVIEASKVMEIG
jgi:exodeoxyribonuclease VIII